MKYLKNIWKCVGTIDYIKNCFIDIDSGAKIREGSDWEKQMMVAIYAVFLLSLYIWRRCNEC
jgi:hypothetical protein